MLKDKVALVTGASRGIGKEIAITLSGYGAKVVVNYCGSKERAEEVVKEIISNGGEAIAYQCDIADFESTKQMINDVVAQFGKIDILVNNAGITKDNLVMKMKEEDFDAVIATNLKGTFNCIKNVVNLMVKARSGRIINMSSVVGIMGNAGQLNYAASKAGVIGMTKSLAKEVASRGITVNAVAPGFIESDMTGVLSDSVKEQITGQIPLKRMGKPKDIAEMVAFLASDNGGYITGQTIQIDGGMGI